MGHLNVGTYYYVLTYSKHGRQQKKKKDLLKLCVNYCFEVGKRWTVRPMAFYAYNSYFDEYEEVGILGGYNDWIDAGVSYRFNRFVSIMIELKVLDFFSIGYNYNVNTAGNY